MHVPPPLRRRGSGLALLSAAHLAFSIEMLVSTRGSGGRHRADRLGRDVHRGQCRGLARRRRAGVWARCRPDQHVPGNRRALIGGAIVFAVGIKLEAIIFDDEPALTTSLQRGFWFGAATCLVALVAALVLIRREARPVEAAPATPAT